MLPVVNKKTLKARGYRVQVYAGNNSRVARNEANNMANKVKEEFPELPVLCLFPASPVGYAV